MSIEQRTFVVKEIDESLRPQIVTFITENWGSPVMVSRGVAHSIPQIPLVGYYDGIPIEHELEFEKQPS